MDRDAFDGLTRLLAKRPSRRTALAALLGAGAAGVFGDVPAKPGRGKKRRPRCIPPGGTCKPGDCCSGICLRPTHDAPEGRCVDLATCLRNKRCSALGAGAECREACFEQMTACLKACPTSVACFHRCENDLTYCLKQCTS